MNSALAVLVALALAIFLIIKKVSPVYSLILGAIVGGLLSGWGLTRTVSEMIVGVKDITPAIVRILAAGVLTGMLVITGAASRISKSIVKGLGDRNIFLALALATMILTAIGVFIDVAVITMAPIALLSGERQGLSKSKLLFAMIGGGKCGNIISPNPNTISAAENFGASLSSVMAAGIIPAIIGLLITVYVILPLMPKSLAMKAEGRVAEDDGDESLPSLAGSLAGPLLAIILLALRPVFGITIDPVVALPAGGLLGLVTTGSLKKTKESLSYGLSKMSVVATLLVGTGTLAGIIKASSIKDLFISALSGWSSGATLMAPVSGALMSAATASTTAGATVASASFASTILAAGVSAVWAAAMTNAGATVLDHLPHGSFFHATGGSVEIDVKDRLKLIPFECATGLVLTIAVTVAYYITL